MKNKLIFSVLAIFAVVAFTGFYSQTAKAEDKADIAVSEVALEQNTEEATKDEMFDDMVFFSEETGEKVDIYSQIISLANGNTASSRNIWKCKSTITYPSGGTSSQTYSSSSNVSGSYCTSNGTRVSVECQLFND